MSWHLISAKIKGAACGQTFDKAVKSEEEHTFYFCASSILQAKNRQKKIGIPLTEEFLLRTMLSQVQLRIVVLAFQLPRNFSSPTSLPLSSRKPYSITQYLPLRLKRLFSPPPTSYYKQSQPLLKSQAQKRSNKKAETHTCELRLATPANYSKCVYLLALNY